MSNKVELNTLTQVVHKERAFLVALNENFLRLQQAINDTLSRTGVVPNQMEEVLDMNGKRVINVGAAVEETDALTKETISGLIAEVEAAVAQLDTIVAEAKREIQRYTEEYIYPRAEAAVQDAEAAKDAAKDYYDDTKALYDQLVGLADNLQSLLAIAEDLTNIDTVVDNLSSIETVSNSINNVDTVATGIVNVNTVANNVSDINTVAGSILDINRLAAIADAITTCSENIAAILAAPVYAEHAETWAEGSDTDVAVLGGTHSAKRWAELSQADVAAEATARENADTGLQNQIDAIVASSDVRDIVGTYTDLQNYDTSTLGNNDIIKVLVDSTHNNATSYYRWIITGGVGAWNYIGSEGPYLTPGAASQTYVPLTRTINSKQLNSDITLTPSDVGAATAAQGSKADTAVQPGDLQDFVPYSSANKAVDLNAQDLKNIDNLAVGTSTVDSNEKIISVGQNRIVTNNQNGLFISSTTGQTRKGMYGVPMALEIQFNSNNQAYSYPLGLHDMNSNNQGGQFLFTSFSSAISAASAGDVMVENDKGGLIFNTGNSKPGSKMRFTVGNWAATPQITVTANSVGIKTLNPNSSYALDVNGTVNASNVLINGQPIQVETDANVQYISGGGGTEYVDLSTLYIDSQGATYGFSYDGMSNTIKNDNVQVDESFAYGYIELYLENDGDITISFSQDSEQNYDFGEISELDQYLNQDNYEDTDYVAWSGKEYGTISDSITFSNVTAGYHFFTIKYIKDSSSETGTDTFEITGIEISGGSSSGSLVDTDTQEEIPLSQINDMPQALQAIRDEIPDTSDFVTLSTKQMITAPKAITGTDVPWGSDQVQKNLFMAVSNSNTTPVVEWIGRSMFGANNLTFLMGTINNMAALGAHSWTSAKQGTGAAWADIYINPDGDKAVKIGGSPMVGRPSIMVIQNMGQTTTGTVKINRRPLLTQSALYKDVACWDDNVSKFNNDAGYITSSDLPTTYVHEQGVASATWTINHNLNKYPSVTVVDSSGNKLLTDVTYQSANTCVITMTAASKGKAYLN